MLVLVFVDFDLTFLCHQQCKEVPPTQLQRTPRVLSALEDAGEVLSQVRRQRRILEENLRALQRRSSAEALEGQLEVLASNRLALALAYTQSGLTFSVASSGSCSFFANSPLASLLLASCR